ncbi:MAG: hypothetical protein L6M37_05210 [Candidatus Methylarchaceae archaeon HK02M1]|nr:hypothetical protein [Candidatus Methylarchaceae archaeon HK02M1]
MRLAILPKITGKVDNLQSVRFSNLDIKIISEVKFKGEGVEKNKKMNIGLILLYFIIGGIVVSATVVIGSEGKGLLAAFIAFFPSITVVTFLMIYLESGLSATLSYVKGLILLTPVWILYLLVFFILMPKIGIYRAMMLGVALYIVSSLIIMRLVEQDIGLLL